LREELNVFDCGRETLVAVWVEGVHHGVGDTVKGLFEFWVLCELGGVVALLFYGTCGGGVGFTIIIGSVGIGGVLCAAVLVASCTEDDTEYDGEDDDQRERRADPNELHSVSTLIDYSKR
jgi:hypothetical protein